MKKQGVLRHWVVALLFAATVGGAAASVVVSSPTLAQSDEDCGGILSLPPWYRGLTDDSCNIVSPSTLDQETGLSQFIWTIALNVIEMIMQLVGYIAIAFLIFGGFKYMTAQGEPSKIMQAKDTIRNALIGLIIAIFSVAIVNFVVGAITA